MLCETNGDKCVYCVYTNTLTTATCTPAIRFSWCCGKCDFNFSCVALRMVLRLTWWLCANIFFFVCFLVVTIRSSNRRFDAHAPNYYTEKLVCRIDFGDYFLHASFHGIFLFCSSHKRNYLCIIIIYLTSLFYWQFFLLCRCMRVIRLRFTKLIDRMRLSVAILSGIRIGLLAVQSLRELKNGHEFICDFQMKI